MNSKEYAEMREWYKYFNEELDEDPDIQPKIVPVYLRHKKWKKRIE